MSSYKTNKKHQHRQPPLGYLIAIAMFLLLFASPRFQFYADQFILDTPAYVEAFHFPPSTNHCQLIQGGARLTFSRKHQAT